MSVRPMNLRRMAKAIAESYGDRGAIVITLGDEGIRVGVESLTPDEARQALCVAISYSYSYEDEIINGPTFAGS